MKSVLSIALTMLLLLSACSGDPPARTPEDVRASDVLRVAVRGENSYPYCYWDDGGEARGIEPEIARRLAGVLQVSAELIAYPEEEIVSAVESGRADIGFAEFEQGAVHGGLIETSSYYTRHPLVLTRRGESYPNESAMSGHTVLSAGSYRYSFAPYTELEAGVANLLDGTADAIICDEFAACAAVAENDGLLIAERYQNATDYKCVGVVARRNEKLYALLDDELVRLMSSGELLEIASPY